MQVVSQLVSGQYNNLGSCSGKQLMLHPLKRVLIVEDDQEMSALIKYKIESFGTAVCDIAEDPYEALDYLSEYPYDFILIDQKLPGMSGVNVISEMDKFADKDPVIIESGRFGKKIPIVFMSAADIDFGDFHPDHFDVKKIVDKKNGLNSFLSGTFCESLIS